MRLGSAIGGIRGATKVRPRKMRVLRPGRRKTHWPSRTTLCPRLVIKYNDYDYDYDYSLEEAGVIRGGYAGTCIRIHVRYGTVRYGTVQYSTVQYLCTSLSLLGITYTLKENWRVFNVNVVVVVVDEHRGVVGLVGIRNRNRHRNEYGRIASDGAGRGGAGRGGDTCTAGTRTAAYRRRRQTLTMSERVRVTPASLRPRHPIASHRLFVSKTSRGMWKHGSAKWPPTANPAVRVQNRYLHTSCSTFHRHIRAGGLNFVATGSAGSPYPAMPRSTPTNKNNRRSTAPRGKRGLIFSLSNAIGASGPIILGIIFY